MFRNIFWRPVERTNRLLEGMQVDYAAPVLLQRQYRGAQDRKDSNNHFFDDFRINLDIRGGRQWQARGLSLTGPREDNLGSAEWAGLVRTG
jgi:hypothetical protein